MCFWDEPTGRCDSSDLRNTPLRESQERVQSRAHSHLEMVTIEGGRADDTRSNVRSVAVVSCRSRHGFCTLPIDGLAGGEATADGARPFSGGVVAIPRRLRGDGCAVGIAPTRFGAPWVAGIPSRSARGSDSCSRLGPGRTTRSSVWARLPRCVVLTTPAAGRAATITLRAGAVRALPGLRSDRRSGCGAGRFSRWVSHV